MAKAKKEGKPKRNRVNLAKRAKIIARNIHLINLLKQRLNEN
jgi:hypothetical protein